MTKAEPAVPGFAEIFATHVPFVGRALRYLGVPERDVADACQEVFVVVHRRLVDYRPEAALRSWIYGICINVARQHRRTARRRPEEPTALVDEALEAPRSSSDERLSAREIALRVLDELDDDKRTVFVLYEVEQLTMEEIVGLVRCPLQTGYSRLRAARALVAETVERLRARGELG